MQSALWGFVSQDSSTSGSWNTFSINSVKHDLQLGESLLNTISALAEYSDRQVHMSGSELSPALSPQAINPAYG